MRTRFRGLPDHLAESVFSEVVFILGEAITNAVKHGKCRTIVLTSDPSPNGFTLSVANDGEPFDPARALGPEAGHFGLTGMRERAKRADIGLSFVHEGRWMILRLAVHA
ncbi:MAG: ATP-binding protein [Kiritimatiellae bacterium]|nr:ATP-binding protein [Kiritimatiellia bacterium]